MPDTRFEPPFASNPFADPFAVPPKPPDPPEPLAIAAPAAAKPLKPWEKSQGKSHEQLLLEGEKSKCLDEIGAILRKHGNMESNIPSNHEYWGLVNRYRSLTL